MQKCIQIHVIQYGKGLLFIMNFYTALLLFSEMIYRVLKSKFQS
ncbi:MAG: hypothetical protein QG670_1675, partial [Thermoproteota archaeon]|nr:hypothetical protein [Thermoproteota archaeon]